MLLEGKSGAPVEAVTRSRTPLIWLAVGTLCLLFAYHGRWSVPLAAWFFAIFLLRFTRLSRVWTGVVGVWSAYALGGAFFFAVEGGIPLVSTLYGLVLTYGSVVVVPYLLDRLLVPRLRCGPLATLVFPAAMVGAEYFLGAVSPLGTVLSSLGATQYQDLPLIQLASVTGTYGISFLLAWFASTVLYAWERGLRGREVRVAGGVFGAVLVLVLAGGTLRIAAFPPDAQTVRVSAVSPSAALDARLHALRERYPSAQALAAGDPAAVRPVFDAIAADLIASTQREAAAGAKIVVWPEAGSPVLAADRQALLARIAAVAAGTGTYVESGLVVLTPQAPYFARNQAVLVDPHGRTVWTYDKAHPVPGMDRIAAGDGRVPAVDSAYGRMANVICFDADFPDLMRQRAGVDLMLVPANDWREMGRVHTEMAAMRAVENGYSLIRSDSHGVSGAFDPLGRSVATADYFTAAQQTMTAAVPTRGVRTVYTAVGDVFAWLCLAGLGLIGAQCGLRRRGARSLKGR